MPILLSMNIRIVLIASLIFVASVNTAIAQLVPRSPEAVIDCKGIDFGPNRVDQNSSCCLPSEQSCNKCFYQKKECENIFGCGTSAINQGCGCNNPRPGACGCGMGNCCVGVLPGNPGNACIAFGGWVGLMGKWDWYWKGFSSGGSTNALLTHYAPYCIENGIICGVLRCDRKDRRNRCTGTLYNGCFDPSSTLLLEGGELVAARDIKRGDMLYNSLTGRSFAVKRILAGPEDIPMVEMGFSGNLLRVTQEHPILTRNGMQRANKIAVGDIVIDAAGNEQTIEYVRLADLVAGQRVVNFELDVTSSDPIDRLIVADNVTSGDLSVQQSALPGEDK